MGWSFTYISRDGLVRSLIAPQQNRYLHRRVLTYALHDNVLWLLVRITARADTPTLAAGGSVTRIHCYVLQCASGMWGYKPLRETDAPHYYTCPLSAPVLTVLWHSHTRLMGLAREVMA